MYLGRVYGKYATRALFVGMICSAFAVVLVWMRIRIWFPMFQVPLSEIHWLNLKLRGP